MSFWKGLVKSIPIVGPLVGGAIDAAQSRKNVKDTIRHQKEMAQTAYDNDLQMWERQNAYNAPTMQMERLKEAGLNPNLVYGTGAQGNTSSQLPKYQAPRPDYTQRRNPLQALGTLGTFQDVKMKNAMIDNVKERTLTETVNRALKAAQENYTNVRAHGETYSNVVKWQRSNVANELSKYSADLAKAELQQKLQDVRNRRLAGDIREKELSFYEWLKIMGMVNPFIGNLKGFLPRR